MRWKRTWNGNSQDKYAGGSVVTEFIVKNSKQLNVWQFIISLLVNIFWM